MIEIPASVLERYRNRTQLPMRGFRPSVSKADTSTTESENDREIGFGDRLLLRRIKELVPCPATDRNDDLQSDARKSLFEIPANVLERYPKRTQLPIRGF